MTHGERIAQQAQKLHYKLYEARRLNVQELASLIDSDEVLAALEKDKEALDRLSATADALREHLLNNPCLNCDIPDEIYVPFSEAIDAALAPTKTEAP